jgi:hypothetical protein
MQGRLRERALAKKEGQEGTMYRAKEVKAMFSIDDEGDEDLTDLGEAASQHKQGRGGGAYLDLAGAILRKTTKGQITVDIDLIRDQPAIKHAFMCNEVLADGYMYPSHLALTTSHLIKLRELKAGRGEAVVLARHPLRTIMKITSKKRHPNLLTFVYEDDGSHEDQTSLYSVHKQRPGDASGTGGALKTETPAAPSSSDAATATLPADKVFGGSVPAAPEKTRLDVPTQGDDKSTGTSQLEKTEQAAEEAVNAITERFLVPEAAAAKLALKHLMDVLPGRPKAM